MTKKFGPERDALNLEISDVVDEIFSLLEKGHACSSKDAPAESPSKTASRKNSIKIKLGKLFVANGSAWTTWRLKESGQHYGVKPLRTNELNSVHTLLAWVADEQNMAPETVQAITETRFNVTDVTHLRQKDYDEVIRFLVDLRIDEICN